jgi:MFS family permease
MRRLFALVATVLLVDTMFLAALAPLLPSYVAELGISKGAAGVLSASYPAGTLLASLPSGWVAARIGVRPTMLIGLALLGVSSVAFAFGDTILVLDLARVAQGIGGAFAWTAGLAWLIGAAPSERRGELIGAAMAAAVTGLVLGPVLGSIATATSPEVVFTGVAVLAAALITWTLATPRSTPAPVRSLREVAGAILTPPILLGFWLVAVPSVLAGAVEVLAPLRLDELGASATVIGAIFLVSAAVEAVISPAIGRLSDRRGRLRMVRVGLLTATGAALLLPLPVTVAPLAIVVVAVFLALTVTWTPSMALLSERTEAAGVDLAFGTALLSLAWAGGQVLGGSVMSALADATTDGVAYASIALLLGFTVAAVGPPGRRQGT